LVLLYFVASCFNVPLLRVVSCKYCSGIILYSSEERKMIIKPLMYVLLRYGIAVCTVNIEVNRYV